MPRQRKSQASSSPNVASWSQIAPPPADPLAANGWVFDVLKHTMFMVVQDTSLSEPGKRREIRETAAAMRGLIPQTRLGEAERVVKGEDEAMAHSAHGPELEHAPLVGVNGSRPKTLRGRPRRR
jgi:hypothetical protein